MSICAWTECKKKAKYKCVCGTKYCSETCQKKHWPEHKDTHKKNLDSGNVYSGQGKMTYADGSVYEGEFVNGELRQGKMTFPDGDVYEGEFVNGERSGQGKMTYASGDVCVGEYENGELRQGKITFTNGLVYEGFIKEGQFVKGQLTTPAGVNNVVWVENSFVPVIKVKNQEYDGGLYTGELVNKKPHGFGTLVRPDAFKKIYKGDWVDGIATGQGIILYNNQNKYDGPVVNMAEGKGKLTFDRHGERPGDVYEGYVVNGDPVDGEGKLTTSEYTYEGYLANKGLPNGQGKMSFTNLDVYEGGFENGELRQGTMTFASGLVYDGKFVDGILIGEGKMTFANGDGKKGIFENGEFRQGTMTFGKTVYDGKFVDGILIGEGKMTFANGNVYDGIFENGKLRQGKITFASGLVYEGNFKNDKRNGQGKTTFGETVYEGNFENDKRSGQGKMTFGETVYEGNFENDKRSGQGKMTLANGVVYEGEWVEDEFKPETSGGRKKTRKLKHATRRRSHNKISRNKRSRRR